MTIYLHTYTEGERLRVTGELVRLRVMPVQELVVDLGLERGALLWSCYNSLHIWDFSKPDESDSFFCGTMTRY